MIRRAVGWLGLAALVAAGGYRARALSGSGTIAATVTGAAIGFGASVPGIVTLGTFFVSSSALSKTRRAPQVSEKGSRRDAVQVVANGGVASVCALAMLGAERRMAFAAMSGSLAAAAADTWATEIGSTSGTVPRLIVSRKPVQPGQSGGVTLPGTLASLAGASLIAGVASGGATIRWHVPFPGLFVRTVVAGVSGSLVDSVAGELVQERRYCPVCRVETEARVHRCGHQTERVGGVPGMTNDVVNLVCTASGGLVAAGLYAVASTTRIAPSERYAP